MFKVVTLFFFVPLSGLLDSINLLFMISVLPIALRLFFHKGQLTDFWVSSHALNPKRFQCGFVAPTISTVVPLFVILYQVSPCIRSVEFWWIWCYSLAIRRRRLVPRRALFSFLSTP